MKTKQELRDEIEELKSEIEFLKVLMLKRERAHHVLRSICPTCKHCLICNQEVPK